MPTKTLAPSVTRTDGVTERGIAYSVDFGLVHFVMLSTEHDFAVGSPQRAWLEKDLAAVDRSKTPWLLTGGHRPMYSSSYGYGVTEAHAEACRNGSYDKKRFNCQDVLERDALEPALGELLPSERLAESPEVSRLPLR